MFTFSVLNCGMTAETTSLTLSIRGSQRTTSNGWMFRPSLAVFVRPLVALNSACMKVGTKPRPLLFPLVDMCREGQDAVMAATQGFGRTELVEENTFALPRSGLQLESSSEHK